MTNDENKPGGQTEKSTLSGLNQLVGQTVFVPDPVAKSRMAICRKCEFLTSTNFCKKCKCMMNIKTRVAVVKCPIDKWTKYSPPPPRDKS